MFSGYLLAIFITSLLYYYNYYSSNHITGTSTTAATSIPLPEWIEKQLTTSYNTMLGNINPPGTAKGFIAASLSTYKPDYFYTWTRDAALVARVLTHVPETPLSVLQDYVEFQIHSQTTATLCNCLGEPKFNPDGTGYTGSWGRYVHFYKYCVDVY
jgi:glucoamylase